MDDHATASATEDRAAGENLRADRGRLAITWQTSCPLELGQEIEQQQHRPKSGFCCEELFHAEAVGSQIVLQLGNAIFHVGTSVVVAPDLCWRANTARHEEAKCIAWHIDQFASHAGASFPDFFTNHNEATLHLPTEQLQTELTG